MTIRSNIGLAGEEECARQLEARGWSVNFLNKIRTNFPNSDLLIAKAGRQRRIQVKASKKQRGYITGGGVNPSIVAGERIFNRVESAPACDAVIFLATQDSSWRYFIMSVDSAEEIFRRNINAYFKSPRLDGLPKRPSGQTDIFVGQGTFPHARIVPDQRAELLPFENAWHLLD